MVNVNIFDIDINKLCFKKNLCLIILFKINKGLKINLNQTIYFLSLVIYLYIKNDEKFWLDTKKII